MSLAGTFKTETVMTSPQGPRVTVSGANGAGSDRAVLNFCSNNYLGFSNHPRLVAAARKSLDEFGFGLSSVRFICGTQAPHEALEKRIAELHGAEAAILLPSTLVMVLACLSWKRLEHSPWRRAFEQGLGPITLGILFAVGLKILRTADTNAAGVLVSVLVCVLMLRSRISPLWFMAVAGVLGGLGVINR